MKNDWIDFIGTFVVPATTKPFIACENFIVNTSDDAKVKISYVMNRFRKYFLDKEEDLFTGSTLHYGNLKEDAFDRRIIAELDGEVKTETTLAEFWATLKKQPNGEKGALLVDEYHNNIFYIRDKSRVLWAVYCMWDREGWRVEAASLDNLWWKTYGTNPYLAWKAGDRFFFRNLSES